MFYPLGKNSEIPYGGGGGEGCGCPRVNITMQVIGLLASTALLRNYFFKKNIFQNRL